ncbi:S-adenosyl methyltransferase [Actinomadura pelletieri DSM 43383]|uniref:S-adenosyl methyltransferase n=1 Tax=Actinomadura pelletieri DSM 43383 TaxID=1120940 RepID=A0A495QTW1_9ACTN|nr:SAM-dependent methyltransferase [Actinomadura pelletieri]RKS76954.1 S-adenosyl methyltransferase [Actinomadura pelletieri DSM 43383]
MGSGDASYSWRDAEKDLMAGIDTSVPHSARIWNYWMGGKDNYPIDQEAGEQFAAIYPGIRDMARVSRYFISRIVRYLAGEEGIRQFLDIGTGLPSHDNTHEVAQREAPDSRIVYVDNDPLVLAHARALLTSNDVAGTDYVDADLNEPRAILDIARTKLDFDRPIALMLMGVLGHLPITEDDEQARSVVDRLKAALPVGSLVAVYDGTNTDYAYVEATRLYNEGGSVPYHLRSPVQITRFLDGLEPVEPGVVRLDRWRPDPAPLGLSVAVDAWGGVAKKTA